MRLIATKSVKPGMILAHPIFNEKGQPLLREGVALTKRLIDRLNQYKITYVYIADSASEGIKATSSISEAERLRAVKTIENTLRMINNSSSLSTMTVLEKNTKQLKGIVSTILEAIQGNQDVLNVLVDVYSYDSYIYQHSYNVTLYSLAIGVGLQLPRKQLEVLGLGALLHDVGKVKVPREILLKPGKLTDEEFEVVKKHTEFGFELLRRLHTVPLVAAHCAYQHHERLNGSGYPRGIKGDEMHEFAKIIAVADVYDAVTSNRVYRKAMLPHEGLELLYSGAGTLFDSSIVEAFRKSISIYPVGVTVELSDGRKGIVAKQNKGVTDRPHIRITEQNGQPLQQPYEMNLQEHLGVTIVKCEA